jgi:hypothetical protein
MGSSTTDKVHRLRVKKKPHQIPHCALAAVSNVYDHQSGADKIKSALDINLPH